MRVKYRREFMVSEKNMRLIMTAALIAQHTTNLAS